jgi:D-amino peptidase
MNVYISIDLEGIAGVVVHQHLRIGNPEFDRFRKLMTAEANAAIEGALEGGAKRIVVADSHSLLNNILLEDLHPAAKLVSGGPRPDFVQGIDSETDVAFLLGQHGMAGTQNAVIEHSISSKTVYQIALNGTPIGEIGLWAAAIGWYGTPVTLVTGNAAAVKEAKELLGEIETVSTKEDICYSSALCKSPQIARQEISQAAKRAMKLKNDPVKVSTPITIAVVFCRTAYADLAAYIPHTYRVDGRTVSYTADTMPEIIQACNAMITISSAFKW